MKTSPKNLETDKYGNITFGEASRLLIDTIGQNVILNRMPKGEQDAFARKLQEMYKGEAVYRKFSTAEPESPQWYIGEFFKDLEDNYKLPRFAMIILDSFTWQFFYAIRSYTPFEKPKKETALFLLRKQIFCFIYHNLMKEKSLDDDGSVLKISINSVMTFLTDSYQKIFSKVETGYKNKETFYGEIKKYCEKYQKLSKKELTDYKQNIINWCNESVYNANWKILVPVLDFLSKQKKYDLVYRLIGLYLRKNAQRAMEDIMDISIKGEQEKIIIDIVTMINGNKKPEEFYSENCLEFSEQINLISMCLAYQHQKNFDPKKSDEIIKVIENKCTHSKKFFSPWLNARAKVFKTGETLKENKEVQDSITNGYRKAYNEGVSYAGEYLGQFLLEAIMINKFCNPRQVKDTNDYHGYGYALEMFGPEKQKLFDLIKETNNLQIEFVNILYSDINPMGKNISLIFPSLPIYKFQNEAILKNTKGLEFDKTNNYGLAGQYFTEAVLLDPVYVNAYSNRGNVYSKMGEQFTENALADFNIALLLDPKHEITLFSRELLFLERGQYEEAIRDFTDVININPEASDAYLGRGNCYKYLEKFDIAMQEYDKAIEINPRYVEAYKSRAVVYKLLGENKKAQEDCCKVRQIDPEFFLKNNIELFDPFY